MATFISHSPAETEALGAEWGLAAARGWVIGLSGDLGAGKTQLVKGIARGLGVTERVHSPTFALLNEYSGGRLPLFHLDLYRLETRDQISGAGLENYFYSPPGIAVIEWIERWGTCNLKSLTYAKGVICRAVKIEVLNETGRRVIYEDFGR
ncbi:MAG: tRNA (adenosine(37)-N6)-threonylcarbamoyltransferase complex ATPase subunit type 1 TsaE [Verrucomicrobiota bacterium]